MSYEAMPVTCSNCRSTWQVTPGPSFDPNDLSTYPQNNCCPHCAEEAFDYDVDDDDPEDHGTMEKYTPDE